MPDDPTEPLIPGIDPRFRILEELGAGGFGVVYLVRDLREGRDVALKTLRHFDPEPNARLKNEFRALQDIQHENLVSFYEMFGEGEHVYFTMEYVQGTTFLRHVRPDLGLDVERLRRAVAQLTRGLSALHDAGKLHRDIKPSNVLVTPEERVVVLDLGLVTQIAENPTGASIGFAGTPAYMPPERMPGGTGRVTPATDWYSAGVLLYQALTGRLPFRGSSLGEVIAEQQRASVTSPRDLDASAPADLCDLCMSLIALDPARRAGAAEILAVVGQESSSPKPAPHDTELVGREIELAQMRGALARVRAGEGVTLLVDGNSGVGKTALVKNFLTTAETAGSATVLRGRCYERERVPYQGIDSLIEDLCRLLNGLDRVGAESVLPSRHLVTLTRLFPGLERVPVVARRLRAEPLRIADGPEIRRQAFGALRVLLGRIADRHYPRTLIVHIDDVQWGDLDTAGLLRDLLRPPDAPIMLLILSYRREDQERSPCLQVLAQEPIGAEVHVHLEPLEPEAAMALLRGLLPSTPTDDDVARLAREAGGNPLLLQEVARFAGEMSWTGKPGPASLDVHGALRARIERLPDAARKLLRTVAVAGYPLTEQVARTAAGLPGPAPEAWHLLVTEHLVRFSGPRDARLVESFHDLTREAVVRALTPQEARSCNGGLAAALEKAGWEDFEVLARHHEQAGNSEQALEFTRRAAAQASKVLAFDRAARLLETAVQLAGADPLQRAALLPALAEALGNAGRCIDSARVYLEAANVADNAEARTRLRRRAADQLFFGGNIDQGRDLIRDDLRAHGVPLSTARRPSKAMLAALRARIWFHQKFLRRPVGDPSGTTAPPTEDLAFLDHVRGVGMVLSFVGLPRHGAEIGARYMLRALRQGDARSVALGTALMTMHAGALRPVSPRTDAKFERLKRECENFTDPVVAGTLSGMNGLHAYFKGDWDGAIRELGKTESFLRDRPDRLWVVWTARHVGVWARFFRGDWDELQRLVLDGLQAARDRGNVYGMAGMCSPFGVAAWLGRDQPAEATRTLEEVAARCGKGFMIQRYWFLMAETLVRLYCDDGPGAWEQIGLRWRKANIPTLNLQLLHLRGCCALAAAEKAGDGVRRARLLREASAAADEVQPIKLPYAVSLAHLLRAGIATLGSPGREEAMRHLEAASAGFEAPTQKMKVYAAAARRRLAQLRGEGDGEFLAGQRIANPDAVTRMLAPGFRVS